MYLSGRLAECYPGSGNGGAEGLSHVSRAGLGIVRSQNAATYVTYMYHLSQWSKEVRVGKLST